MKKPNNPHVHPVHYTFRHTIGRAFTEDDFDFEGMTLLDYFAGQALGTVIKRIIMARVFSNNLAIHQADEAIAKKCYRVAKAMLKEREKYEK